MNASLIRENLDKNLRDYDRAMSGIKQSVSAYESECKSLIEKISKVESFCEANKIFDHLLEIQNDLCKVTFARDIRLNNNMEDLVREFDRLYEPETRRYWYEQFRNGVTWPH